MIVVFTLRRPRSSQRCKFDSALREPKRINSCNAQELFMNKTKLRKVLSNCGLHESAVRIYVESQSRGTVSRRILSQAVSLSETTTRKTINRLARCGLVTTRRTSTERFVRMVPPAKAFRRLIAEQEQVKKRAAETIAGLRALAKTRRKRTAGR